MSDEDTPKWRKQASGSYTYASTKVDAVVYLDGEIWRNRCYYEGLQVDVGEWAGRDQAFRAAIGGMRRALMLRRDVPLPRDNEDDAMEEFLA